MRKKVLHGLFVSGCLLMDHEEFFFLKSLTLRKVGTVSYYNVCLAVELVHLVNFPNDKFHFVDYSLVWYFNLSLLPKLFLRNIGFCTSLYNEGHL